MKALFAFVVFICRRLPTRRRPFDEALSLRVCRSRRGDFAPPIAAPSQRDAGDAPLRRHAARRLLPPRFRCRAGCALFARLMLVAKQRIIYVRRAVADAFICLSFSAPLRCLRRPHARRCAADAVAIAFRFSFRLLSSADFTVFRRYLRYEFHAFFFRRFA